MDDIDAALERLREAAATDDKRTVSVGVADLRLLLRENEQARSTMIGTAGSGGLGFEREAMVETLEEEVEELRNEVADLRERLGEVPRRD